MRASTHCSYRPKSLRDSRPQQRIDRPWSRAGRSNCECREGGQIKHRRHKARGSAPGRRALRDGDEGRNTREDSSVTHDDYKAQMKHRAQQSGSSKGSRRRAGGWSGGAAAERSADPEAKAGPKIARQAPGPRRTGNAQSRDGCMVAEGRRRGGGSRLSTNLALQPPVLHDRRRRVLRAAQQQSRAARTERKLPLSPSRMVATPGRIARVLMPLKHSEQGLHAWIAGLRRPLVRHDAATTSC